MIMTKENKAKLNDEQLETVTGGSQQQMNDLIHTFREFGFDYEADFLAQNNNIYDFGPALKHVLEQLEFPETLEIRFRDGIDPNTNAYRGKHTTHDNVISRLEDFLMHKKGAEWISW